MWGCVVRGIFTLERVEKCLVFFEDLAREYLYSVAYRIVCRGKSHADNNGVGYDLPVM